MKALTSIVSPILASLVLASCSVGGSDSTDADASPALLKARLDAARKTYEWLSKNYIESRPPLGELLYRWSCRWLDAEREMSGRQEDRVAAYRAHLRRMRDLERVARDRFRNRFVPVEEDTAAQFYLAEAEIWLERAKHR
jgi:hypothetical protein